MIISRRTKPKYNKAHTERMGLSNYENGISDRNMENFSSNPPYSGGIVTTDTATEGEMVNCKEYGEAYLLHVSQHILPAVKHPPPFFRVQLVDKVCGVVFIRVLIPTNTGWNTTVRCLSLHPPIQQHAGDTSYPKCHQLFKIWVRFMLF